MKSMISKTVLIGSLLISVSLTACSANNPLETEPRDKALDFVETASMVAEKNLAIKAYPPGSTYYDCMTNSGMVDKRSNPNICDDVYQEMLVYAESSNGSFSHLRLSDLKDTTAFRKLYQLPLDNQG